MERLLAAALDRRGVMDQGGGGALVIALGGGLGDIAVGVGQGDAVSLTGAGGGRGGDDLAGVGQQAEAQDPRQNHRQRRPPEGGFFVPQDIDDAALDIVLPKGQRGGKAALAGGEVQQTGGRALAVLLPQLPEGQLVAGHLHIPAHEEPGQP